MLNDGFQYLEQRDAQDNITKQGVVSKKSPFATADNTGIYDTIAENFRWLKDEIGGLYDTAEIKKIQDTITAMYNEMKTDPRWGSVAAKSSAEEAIEAAKKAIAAKESAESSEKVSTANAQDAHKTYNDCQNVLSQTRVLLDKTNKDLIKRRDEANELFDRRTAETNKLFDNREAEATNIFTNNEKVEGSRHDERMKEANTLFDTREKETNTLFDTREAEATKLFKDKTNETNTLFDTREAEATKLFNDGDAAANALFDKRTKEANTLFDTRTQDTKTLFDTRTQTTNQLFDTRTNETNTLFDRRTQDTKDLFDKDTAAFTKLYTDDTAATEKLFEDRTKEATALFDNGDAKATQLFDTRTKEANNLFDTREKEANTLFDTRKGEAEAIAKKAIEDVNNTLTNSNQSAVAAKASADAAAQTEKEVEKLKTDTIAETTAIKDAAIAETGKIKDAAIADTTAIKNEAQAQEELAKKWAIATDSPDGALDADSETQKTMSSRSWALVAKVRADGALQSSQEAYQSKERAYSESLNAQNANTAAQAALAEIKTHVQDSEAKIDEALKEANAARDKNANAMAYLGSVATYDDLPKTNKVGDVWRIEKKDSTHKTAKGAKILWTGQQWEAIGGGGGGTGEGSPLAFLQNEYLIEHMPDSPYVENFANPKLTNLGNSSITIKDGKAMWAGNRIFLDFLRLNETNQTNSPRHNPYPHLSLFNESFCVSNSEYPSSSLLPYMCFSFTEDAPATKIHPYREDEWANPYEKHFFRGFIKMGNIYSYALYFSEYLKSGYRYLRIKPFGLKNNDISDEEDAILFPFFDEKGNKKSIEIYAKGNSQLELTGYNPMTDAVKSIITHTDFMPHFSFPIMAQKIIIQENGSYSVDNNEIDKILKNKKGDFILPQMGTIKKRQNSLNVYFPRNTYRRNFFDKIMGKESPLVYNIYGTDDDFVAAGWRFVD